MSAGADGELKQDLCVGLGAMSCTSGATATLEAGGGIGVDAGATVIATALNHDHSLTTSVTFSLSTSDAADFLGADLVLIPILRCGSSAV